MHVGVLIALIGLLAMLFTPWVLGGIFVLGLGIGMLIPVGRL